MSKNTVIKFSDFSFCYQNLAEPSLKNINLEIYAGEKILIAGRSGCGKSTLLHCINGIIPYANYGELSGSLEIVRVNSQDEEGIFAHSRQIGTILQDQDSQFIGLSVAEDVAFTLENNALPRHEMQAIVSNALAQVAMSEFSALSPYELSGGQKQRVSLAGILASAPNILLFDEPLANLDPASSAHVVELVRELNYREQKTIIIAEHRIEEVLEAKIDRMIVMDKGEIVADGTPCDILASGICEQIGLRIPLYTTAVKLAATKSGLPAQIITNTSMLKQLSEDSLASLRQWANSLPLPASKEPQPSNTTPALSINNLSFAYLGQAKVLKELAFNLNHGEMVSILGNNGAGKSTLTYLINGTLKLQHGQILLNGSEINHWSIKQRGEKIALIMQNPNSMLVKALVRDEIILGLKSQNIPVAAIEVKLEQVLRTCGLWGYRNWPIAALSYGQKKRVTIAAMLALNPEILILDEPTAGQDLKIYHEFMGFIADLAKQGIAILIITHDLYLAMEYTTRSIVLADGEKIADDTPARVFANPEVLQRANLKAISLSLLAQKLELDPATFIQQFIDYTQRTT